MSTLFAVLLAVVVLALFLGVVVLPIATAWWLEPVPEEEGQARPSSPARIMDFKPRSRSVHANPPR